MKNTEQRKALLNQRPDCRDTYEQVTQVPDPERADPRDAYKQVAQILSDKETIGLHEALCILEKFDAESARVKFLKEMLKDLQQPGHGEHEEINVHEFSDLVGQLREENGIGGISASFEKSFRQKRAKAFTRQALQAIDILEAVFKGLKLNDAPSPAKAEATPFIINDWHDAVAEAVQHITEIWNKVTPEFFFNSITALEGDDLLTFTECMLFKLPNKDKLGKKQCSLADLCGYLPTRRLMSNSNDIVMARSTRTFLEENSDDVWGTQGRTNNWLDQFFSSPVVPALAFTTNCLPFRLDEYPPILIAIKDASASFIKDAGNPSVEYASTSHGQSLFFRAILTHAWHGDFGYLISVQLEFYIRMLREILFLYFIIQVANEARVKRLPPGYVWFFLLILSIGICVGQFSELWCAVKWRKNNCDKSRSCVRMCLEHIYVGKLWTVFDFVLSLYGVGLILGLMYFTWGYSKLWDKLGETVETPILYKHPLWIAIFVFFKLQQIIQKVLAIRAFGEHVIPAYAALFDKSCTRFVLFTGLIWFNSFLTYYAIPVQLDKHFLPNIWLKMVAMYRLDFSGDFSLNEMEGLDQMLVKTNSDGNKTIGKIVDDTGYTQWHYGIHALYMIFFLFVNIGLLNVLIGIVGNNYSRFYRMRKDLFENYRAVYSYKILLGRNAGWKKWLFSRKTWCCSRETDDHQDDKMWLLFNPDVFEVEIEDQIRLMRMMTNSAEEPVLPSHECQQDQSRLLRMLKDASGLFHLGRRL